jgi:hypothetical protein
MPPCPMPLHQRRRTQARVVGEHGHGYLCLGSGLAGSVGDARAFRLQCFRAAARAVVNGERVSGSTYRGSTRMIADWERAKIFTTEARRHGEERVIEKEPNSHRGDAEARRSAKRLRKTGKKLTADPR